VNSADDFSRKLLAADVGTVTLDKSTGVKGKVLREGMESVGELRGFLSWIQEVENQAT
jgi:hypothetical protein